MKKKLLWILGIIGLVVVVGTILTVIFLGHIVKAGMETVGPKITGTTIKADSIAVLLTGSASIHGLIVGPPEGYKSDTISIGKAAASIAPLSLLADKIVIHSVEVRDMVINYDGIPIGGKNNLDKILENVNIFTGAADKPATNTAAKTDAPAKKLQVDHFVISGAKVVFNGVPLPLPSMELKDLGAGPNGITPANLIKEVLSQVTVAAAKEVGKAATDLGKGAGKAVTDGVNSIGKGIGDLFKK